jgi:hypothetical protein
MLLAFKLEIPDPLAVIVPEFMVSLDAVHPVMVAALTVPPVVGNVPDAPVAPVLPVSP